MEGGPKLPFYSHSVTLDPEKCHGCTNCIKRCPTEAIRVRKGRATITEYRCIDCGECIRNCPYRAKKAVTDPFESIFQYDIKVAIPAPALYGQFEESHSIDAILSALIYIGFDEVFEVARAAELVAAETKRVLDAWQGPSPVISASCPAALRLIQIRFPSLIDHVAPVLSPMEIAARIIRRHFADSGKNVGIFFISPCAAKVTDVRSPIGSAGSEVNGVIAIKDLYLQLRSALGKCPVQPHRVAGSAGIAWARIDGESDAVGERRRISVDGIANVIDVLEAAENGKLKNIAFIEAMACPAGCVGGPLVVENPFIAKVRIRNRESQLTGQPINPSLDPAQGGAGVAMAWTEPMHARGDLMLSMDMEQAMTMESELEAIAESLPGLDCGSCGAPTCRALAEDIVRGSAGKNDCVFKLRENVRKLVAEMVELEQIKPPGLDRET